MIAASCRSITGCDLISTARYYVQCTTLSLIFNVNEVPMRNVRKYYLYWNGLAPPTEWFQSLCYLVSTSSQARYYVRCGMRNDVWPRFPVFFYLYFGLQGVRNDASVQECTMANLQLHKILYCRISHISSGHKKSISEFKNRILKVFKKLKKIYMYITYVSYKRVKLQYEIPYILGMAIFWRFFFLWRTLLCLVITPGHCTIKMHTTATILTKLINKNMKSK
jgi:hypothetical protein